MQDQNPTAPEPPRKRGRLRGTAVTLVLGVVMFAVGAVGLAPPGSSPTGPAEGGKASRTTAAGRGSVAALQERVRRLPKDTVGWAALGMAYVQQARATADPATYDRAENALRTSLKLQPSGNHPAETAMGALAAGRHDFAEALDWAERATTTNPYSATAHGVLADAYTQLGRYEDAYRAVQRMVDLRPDSASYARASYTWELRGDVGRARDLMTRSLGAAATTGERSFARTHLALLALENGDPRTALAQAGAGLGEDARDTALLEARARAHAALGDTERAVTDYTAAIAIAPLPHHLLGLGELQQALRRPEQAEAQYAILRAQEQIRRASGGPADVDAILFEADHGDARKAVTMAGETVAGRPFIAVHDAYAWALHRAGRSTDALAHADQALALGTRSALFHYHRGMIHASLGHSAQAQGDLRRALAIDPRFHPLHAPEARSTLSRIDGTA
ncbi:tetratricopeptide repeat protein [Streptomyces sp. NPDC058486]|uniref:tetratricopeptide repeat protein n=1 Tax=unclassified Streptomyces TaxID=2593676 RepID=UPI003656719E